MRRLSKAHVFGLALAMTLGASTLTAYRVAAAGPTAIGQLQESAFKEVVVPTDAPSTTLSVRIPAEDLTTGTAPSASPTPAPTPKATPKPTPRPVFKPVYRPQPRPLPVVTGSRSAAKAYALSVVGAVQFACLNLLWTRESNWNPLAANASGAYGIPQALPGSKMSSFGSDWQTNPITQVKWGLSYIRSRYGTACNAWAHSQTFNWY